MLGVSEKFPFFSLKACVSGTGGVRTLTHEDFPGTWKVYFFWPKDFTELARSEIIEFARLAPEFSRLNAQLLGASIESESAWLAWRKHDAALRDLPFPILSDTHRELCGQLGILDDFEGVAQPSSFIVDPAGVIRFVYATDLHVASAPGEVLRVLADLQDVSMS